MRLAVAVLLITLGACSSATEPPPPPERGMVVFDGNSLLDNGSGVVPSWPDLTIASLKAPEVTYANLGVTGQTTADILSHVAIETDTLFTKGEPDVYVAWEVSNDLYFGASADSAYARIVRLGQEQRAKGWRVIVLTPMPRGNFDDSPGWEDRRQATLALMRENWRTFADELVDVAADPILGNYQSLDDTRYFRDRVHLGPEGIKIVAALVAPVVQRQLER